MNRNRLKIDYFIDVGLFVSVIIVAITGILKFKTFTHAVNIDMATLPMRQINFLHEWSGVVMSVLVLVHIILHFKWFWKFTKGFITGQEKGMKGAVILTLLLAISIFAYSIAYLNVDDSNTGSPNEIKNRGFPSGQYQK